MTQKGDPYIKVFSTLSEVRVLSCVLSRLNTLCTSLVKPCCSKNDDSPVIHLSHVTAILRVLRRIRFHGWTENAGVDIDGVDKKRGWTLQEWTMTEYYFVTYQHTLVCTELNAIITLFN